MPRHWEGIFVSGQVIKLRVVMCVFIDRQTHLQTLFFPVQVKREAPSKSAQG